MAKLSHEGKLHKDLAATHAALASHHFQELHKGLSGEHVGQAIDIHADAAAHHAGAASHHISEYQNKKWTR